jgi:hypothetical protein
MVIDPRLYEKVTGRRANAAEQLGMANMALDKRRGELAEEKARAMARIRGTWSMGHRWLLIEAAMRRPMALVVVLVLLALAGWVLAETGGFRGQTTTTRQTINPVPGLVGGTP